MASCRPGSLEEKLAVFCCRGKDLADELAYLVDLLVSGGKGVCYLWAKTRAVEDPVDGVVPSVEGLLRSGEGVWSCVRARLDLCVGGGDGPNPGHGPRGWPAALDPVGQAEHG